MRKVVHLVYVSLDGVVEDPAWTGPFFNDEIAAIQREALFASDALLLGRVTYEGFAASWPSMTDEAGFADRMNELPKYVASRTLQATEWGASLLAEDVVAEVTALKKEDGGDLLIYGSATFADTLTRAGLIDAYTLVVCPVVLGRGARLFRGATMDELRLTTVTTTTTGVAVLTYDRPR